MSDTFPCINCSTRISGNVMVCPRCGHEKPRGASNQYLSSGIAGSDKSNLQANLGKVAGMDNEPLKTTTTVTSGGTPTVQGKCAFCEQSVVGQAVQALNKVWHSKCFNCDVCKANFQQTGRKMLDKDGKPYCESCYNTKFGGGSEPPCPGCGKDIVGNFIKSCGKEWHAACLKCSKCSKQLSVTDPIYNKGGNPHCQSCK
eukprot:TRINITY_DN15390_c0_g1_i1.p1 TRINITY_DN15390_c0_g1~~TRINITY_DN15390_c0_g1_i1.p1  ORF type:complete len:212 (-),score=24.63 TRINITY_DN15390_c0_g1_i1:60-659(-)